MTVQDTAPEVTFVGTGFQTSFVFTFRVDDIAWLSVDYVVNFDQFLINADQDASPGGSVEYLVAPPALQELTVLRTTPKTQELNYTRYDPFDSESTEDSIDKLTMLIQDVCTGFESHILDLDIHFPDAPADGLFYVRQNNLWVVDPFAAPVDHLALVNIGVNTHTQIDAHIANASIHFGDALATGDDYVRNNNAWVIASTGVSDHFLLTNIGVNTHVQIDAHVADSTIHFLEASIDHTAISNIGVNSHAAIDTHIATANIHYVDAPADAQDYVRNNNAWAVATPGIPGGADTQIQYNNAGAFAGDANFLWDQVNKRLTLSGLTGVSPMFNILNVLPGSIVIQMGGIGSGSTNHVIYKSFDQNATNYWEHIDDHSLSTANHRLYWRNQAGLRYLEFDNSSEMRIMGSESTELMYLNAVSGVVAVRNDATLYLEHTTVNANIANHGQIWVDQADGDPYYTDAAGATSALIGAGGVLPVSTIINTALEGNGTTGWRENTRFRFGSAFQAYNAGLAQFVQLDYNAFAQLSTSAGDLVVDLGAGTGNLFLNSGTCLSILEQAAPNADIASRGQFWVRDDATMVPVFTDDAGVTTVLNSAGVTDHTLLTNIGVNTHAQIDTHIADGTIHFAVGSIDHGLLLGLADDDHINYFFALGRAGGQSMIGGTGPVESIELRGSSDADLGTIFMQSPVEFQSIAASGAPYAFNYDATELYTVGFVGGGLNMSGDITFTNSTFIYESFRGAPVINTAVNPGFAAYTVLQALPSIRSGAGATHDPLAALVINAGPSFVHLFTGTRTVNAMTGISVTGTGVTAGGLGGTLNFTTHAGIVYRPQWNTGVGSIVNFGACTGLWARNPGVVLFGGSAGTERLESFIAVDLENITLSNAGGTAVRRALRSALSANTQNLMIENIGGAESDFGLGDIHLDDNTYIKYGADIATADMIVGWDSAQAALVYSTFFGVTGNPLYLQGTVNDEWVFKQNTGGALDVGIGFNVNVVTFGVALPTPNSNNYFVRFEGPNNRQVQSAGVYSDIWWTAGGLVDVNGLAATEINAYRIDPIVTVLNGGSVQDQSSLHIAGMGFPGSGTATRLQSLRVTGRNRVDGHMNYGARSPAQITANQNDYRLGITNSGRTMNLLDSDAARNITGIDSAIDYGQDGDCVCLYNVGAFNISLTHQDVLSLAGNRFISSTGVTYIIGPDECVWIYYDLVVARWRLLEGTGA